MRTVSAASVAANQEGIEELPERVQETLGELVCAAKEGLLALSVGVGLGVLGELMAEEVEEVCGPKGRHDRDRVPYRHSNSRAHARANPSRRNNRTIIGTPSGD